MERSSRTSVMKKVSVEQWPQDTVGAVDMVDLYFTTLSPGGHFINHIQSDCLISISMILPPLVTLQLIVVLRSSIWRIIGRPLYNSSGIVVYTALMFRWQVCKFIISEVLTGRFSEAYYSVAVLLDILVKCYSVLTGLARRKLYGLCLVTSLRVV